MLDGDELAARLGDSRRELFNLRFQLATGQLDNPARIGQVRREVARMLTVLRAREILEVTRERATEFLGRRDSSQAEGSRRLLQFAAAGEVHDKRLWTALSQATGAAVRAALAGLPRQQRAVLVLRYFADLPEVEIAQALGCSVGSVKTHASRGARTMRARLGADFGTPKTVISALPTATNGIREGEVHA